MLRNTLFVFILLVTVAWSEYNLNKPLFEFKRPAYIPEPVIDLDSILIKEVELGRYLFFDSILSVDSSLSCASCHNPKKAFSGSPLKLSQGFHGKLTKRNTPPLFNLAWYNSFFWDGRATSLQAQIVHPLNDSNELNFSLPELIARLNQSPFYLKKFKDVFGINRIDSLHIVSAISKFEISLLSFNSRFDSIMLRKAQFTPDEFKGYELVNDQTKGNCLHCHTTDANGLGTTGEMINTGLNSYLYSNVKSDSGRAAVTGKMSDLGKFKTPSLRNLAFTAPYMHDGRFKTLEEVLDFYNSGVHSSVYLDFRMLPPKDAPHFTEIEKQQMLAFLKTLNDYSFVNDTSLKSPF